MAEAWVGQFAGRSADGTVTLRNARPLHAGLCVGSPDLVGFTNKGRFLGIEVKMPGGRRSEEQENFIRVVLSHGGLAGFASSIEDAHAIINQTQKK